MLLYTGLQCRDLSTLIFKLVVLSPFIVSGEKQESLAYWSFGLLRWLWKNFITLHLLKGSLGSGNVYHKHLKVVSLNSTSYACTYPSSTNMLKPPVMENRHRVRRRPGMTILSGLLSRYCHTYWPQINEVCVIASCIWWVIHRRPTCHRHLESVLIITRTELLG